ncbi:hypothetical protein COOONC_18462 [Cooperia oncophora]
MASAPAINSNGPSFAQYNGPSSAFKPYDTKSGQTAPVAPFPGPSMPFQPSNPFPSTQGIPPPVQQVPPGPVYQTAVGSSASVVHQNSSYNSSVHMGHPNPPCAFGAHDTRLF